MLEIMLRLADLYNTKAHIQQTDVYDPERFETDAMIEEAIKDLECVLQHVYGIEIWKEVY